MQMTLTIDDDLATALQKEVKSNGRSFKETVSDLLRLALRVRPAKAREVAAEPFRVQARHLGVPPADLDFDNISELLERIEGPGHR
jgi:hypothetical protein